MSQDIWMQCGGKSNFVRIETEAWRIVESQHKYATRKLVDSDEEQKILEEEIETSKPHIPQKESFRGLHYLLFTPFRYPPLRYGSRFGAQSESGIWYGATQLSICFAEKAYYSFLIRQGTQAKLESDNFPMTAYNVKLRTNAGINLTAKPFDPFKKKISSKVSYEFSQPLGSAMREAGVTLFLFRSARAENGLSCVGLFDPKPFVSKDPISLPTWEFLFAQERVEFVRDDEIYTFDRSNFLVGGKLPAPGLSSQ